MTLVELLLSISIAVVAVALAFSLFRTVSTTLQGQAAREKGGRAALGALDLIRDDLQRAFAPGGAPDCGFTLQPSDGATNMTGELAFCILVSPAGVEAARWPQVVRIRYRTEAPAGSAPRLVRIEEPLGGPGALAPPVTNVAVDELRRFAAELWDGSSWLNAWAADDEKAPPRAARVWLAPAQGSRETADEPLEIYIPAGLVVTSSFERTGAAVSTPAAAPP